MKIGIPRALLYYYYFPLWKTFYEELGYEIILSPKTNKNILDLGVKTCVDEACLPIKVFHGHVESIKNKVDFLFIPRNTSLNYGEFTCPKLCGLPEMIKNSIAELPLIIKPDFNLHNRRINLDKTIRDMIEHLEVDFKHAQDAYSKGIKRLEVYRKNLFNGMFPDDALKITRENFMNVSSYKEKGRLLILSHPYNLYDTFINMNLLKKLREMGYLTITVDNISEEKINYYAGKLPKKMFWTFGRQLIGSGLYVIEEKEALGIDGVIFLSSFACGLDSIIADYIERHIKRQRILPFIQLTIDEQTGEAGIDTRIEAFIEMIERRKANDSNLSSYGECIHRS